MPLAQHYHVQKKSQSCTRPPAHGEAARAPCSSSMPRTLQQTDNKQKRWVTSFDPFPHAASSLEGSTQGLVTGTAQCPCSEAMQMQHKCPLVILLREGLVLVTQLLQALEEGLGERGLDGGAGAGGLRGERGGKGTQAESRHSSQCAAPPPSACATSRPASSCSTTRRVRSHVALVGPGGVGGERVGRRGIQCVKLVWCDVWPWTLVVHVASTLRVTSAKHHASSRPHLRCCRAARTCWAPGWAGGAPVPPRPPPPAA